MKVVSNLFGRALRETGQAVDRIGLTISGNEIFRETFSRHRSVMNLFDKKPVIGAGTFVAPNASIVGKVLLCDKSSVWYGAVIRGDKSSVSIGHATNIQDRAVIDTEASLDSGHSADVIIGSWVTVGHGALLTSCTVRDMVLIGQGCIIQKGSVIESGSIVAAGAVVLPGTFIAPRQLWAGNPAKYIRDVTDQEYDEMEKSAEDYYNISTKHAEEFLQVGTAYQGAEKLNLIKS